MATIIGYLINFWVQAKIAAKWGLDGGLYILKLSLYFVVDGLLTVVYAIVGALDVGTFIFNVGALWSGLPSQLIYIINAVGLPSGLSMLLYAIVIRMLLNLIPAAVTRI